MVKLSRKGALPTITSPHQPSLSVATKDKIHTSTRKVEDAGPLVIPDDLRSHLKQWGNPAARTPIIKLSPGLFFDEERPLESTFGLLKDLEERQVLQQTLQFILMVIAHRLGGQVRNEKRRVIAKAMWPDQDVATSMGKLTYWCQLGGSIRALVQSLGWGIIAWLRSQGELELYFPQPWNHVSID